MFQGFQNNYGMNPVNPYPQNPYMERLQALQQPQAPRCEIIHVNGENGARAFRMAPNSQCLLLDDTNPIIWLCVSDGAGYHTATPYKIEPYTPQNPQQDIQSVYGKIAELEKEIEGIKSGMNQPPLNVSEIKAPTGSAVSAANIANPGNGNP